MAEVKKTFPLVPEVRGSDIVSVPDENVKDGPQTKFAGNVSIGAC